MAYIISFAQSLSAQDNAPEDESVDLKLSVQVQGPRREISPLAPIQVRVDPEVCGSERAIHPLLIPPTQAVHDGVLWLDGPQLKKPFSPPEDKAIFRLKKCDIYPAVLIVGAGQIIRVLNEDPLLHTLRIRGHHNAPLVRVLPPQLKAVEFKLASSEIVEVSSDLHPWMKAFIFVAPHSMFTVLNKEGRGVLKKVPQGQYRIHVWHPALGHWSRSDPLVVNQSTQDVKLLWPQPDSVPKAVSNH